MAEYITKEQALMQLTGRFPNGISLEKYIRLVNFRLNGLEPADVVERVEYDKMVQSFRDRNENLKQNLINTRNSYFKLEKEITELEVKIDKVIGEIKSIDLIVHDGINHYYRSGEEIKAAVIEILKMNIGER
ncbi:hypothetical protein [Eubacterium oxidoreducens]|uniref:Uncharacterized protein n=1 Tax=Eubacterium oxidoreducens TaxID=1732 RepID=A0A1G6B3F4_EUBOX|nr:hypothetical protein [Eubacterium oxidoreducens]SDB15200.1 hypothetical protein SAMN02910417_01124 [Eubacterium oxidoreducens]